MERKGTVTEKGKKNREILSINRILGSLKRAAKKLGEKIAELMEAIRHQEVLEKPQEHSLIDVILATRPCAKQAGKAGASMPVTRLVSEICRIWPR